MRVRPRRPGRGGAARWPWARSRGRPASPGPRCPGTRGSARSRPAPRPLPSCRRRSFRRSRRPPCDRGARRRCGRADGDPPSCRHPADGGARRGPAGRRGKAAALWSAHAARGRRLRARAPARDRGSAATPGRGRPAGRSRCREVRGHGPRWRPGSRRRRATPPRPAGQCGPPTTPRRSVGAREFGRRRRRQKVRCPTRPATVQAAPGRCVP
jgi:hypothetical protein